MSPPTRPPFAEFSAIGVGRMMEWVRGDARWSARLEDVLYEHVEPVVEQTGIAAEDILNALGEQAGECMGAVFEDLCSRRYAEPPQNAVDEFLRKRGHRLPPLAKVYLQALRDSTPGVYEVTAVRPGEGVRIRDLLLAGDPVDVIEVMGSRSLVQWDRIAARVVSHGGKRVFTGAVIPLKSEAAKSFAAAMQERFHTLVETERVVDALTYRAAVADALRESAPRIAALRIAEVLESRRRPLPELRTTEGDPFELVEARYTFAKADRKTLVSRLDAHDALERAGRQPPAWVWLGPHADAPAADGRFTAFAHLRLAGQRLLVTANSRGRFDKTREMIEPLLAGIVGEPQIVVHSVNDLLNDVEVDDEAAEEALPPAEEARLVHEYLDRHYRAVLDETVPMLGGLTPREASRDPAGRARLVDLLKLYENTQARAPGSAMGAYDFGWMWRELGIEHLRK